MASRSLRDCSSRRDVCYKYGALVRQLELAGLHVAEHIVEPGVGVGLQGDNVAGNHRLQLFGP
jgi:hypothetical protein